MTEPESWERWDYLDTEQPEPNRWLDRKAGLIGFLLCCGLAGLSGTFTIDTDGWMRVGAGAAAALGLLLACLIWRHMGGNDD